ncbi:MAG: hypothetical protein VB138_11860, partial [Burkholderia sp.]
PILHSSLPEFYTPSARDTFLAGNFSCLLATPAVQVDLTSRMQSNEVIPAIIDLTEPSVPTEVVTLLGLPSCDSVRH